jgi:hypothetical protein
MAQTLAQLRAEAQQRSNQENKTLVATADWNRYINEAIAELYDLVLSVNPHYYVSNSSFTLTSLNTLDLTTLTPTFYKLRGVDYLPSANGQPVTVHPFNFLERNRWRNQGFAGTYTIWYTPAPPTLVADGDVLDFILNTWAEFIPVTAAIVAAVKEESDISSLAAQKVAIADRITTSAPTRDSEPGQAADLTTPQDYDWDYTGAPASRVYSLEGSSLVIRA